MDIKSQKRLETEQAISAFKTSLKSVTALIAVSVTYFANFNVFALVLSVFTFLYSAFTVVEQKAFPTLVKYFRRAIKFKKIHNFFDEIQEKKTDVPIKQFFAKDTPKKRRHHHKADKHQQAQDIMEEIQRMPTYVPSQIYNEEYVHHPFPSKSGIERQTNKKEYEKQYIQVRDEYKKSFTEICRKEGNRQQFEAIVGKISNFYVQKVLQLLRINQLNLKNMKEQLEKHYQIKILQTEGDEKSVELVNVTIDEAITRILEFKQRKCFPWTEKADRQAKQPKNHQEKLQKIIRDRKQIDRFLAPYYPLTQKLRQEVVKALEHQINHPTSLGRQLTYTAVEIFNDKLKANKNDEQFCIFKKDFTCRPSLEILQTKIQDRFHIDLLLKRPAKQQLITCNPGENNLWTLIGFAIEILRNKL